ncbi:MAG: PHP domain-containing protein [Candidatus Aenigmatarchaeota archaeon]
MKIDMHVHTKYSGDCGMTPKVIAKVERRCGIGCVAITDHNAFAAFDDFRGTGISVIKGEEITTDKGHLIGLFLEEEIMSRNFFDACDEIKRNGGLRMLPHPFRSHAEPETLAESVDLIEIFNSRTSAGLNAKALELADRRNIPGICGSDAHFGMELGKCVAELDFNNARKALLKGNAKLYCEQSPFFVHPATWAVKLARKFTGR